MKFFFFHFALLISFNLFAADDLLNVSIPFSGFVAGVESTPNCAIASALNSSPEIGKNEWVPSSIEIDPNDKMKAHLILHFIVLKDGKFYKRAQLVLTSTDLANGWILGKASDGLQYFSRTVRKYTVILSEDGATLSKPVDISSCFEPKT